jgi:predicted RNase H-like nuclease (RuvC/YqgF family)
VKNKIAKRPKNKLESILLFKQKNMKLQNKILFQDNKIFKLHNEVLKLKEKVSDLEKEIVSLKARKNVSLQIEGLYGRKIEEFLGENI